MQNEVLAQRWLPHLDPDDPETVGKALWLEREYWRRMSIAVCNGIGKAFGQG